MSYIMQVGQHTVKQFIMFSHHVLGLNMRKSTQLYNVRFSDTMSDDLRLFNRTWWKMRYLKRYMQYTTTASTEP